MRQMNKFTPTWMEPKVIRSISDAALSMASSALSSIGGSCHTKGKHAQVDPYFDIPIRWLPRYITVRKEIRAVSGENSALQRAKAQVFVLPFGEEGLKLGEWDIFPRLSHFAKGETRKCKKKTRSFAMQSEVRVCKPSIAKRAFLLLRLKSSTRSTSSDAASMMRTAGAWVCAVSLLLLLLLEDYSNKHIFQKTIIVTTD